MYQFIKTDNDVKIELNTGKKSRANIINEMDDNFIVPRYGTTVDLKNNKIVDNNDKYTTRNRNLSLNKTKYKISRISIDSRNRNLNPKNIISNYISIDSPFMFTANSNLLHIEMPLNHGLKIDSNITIGNVLPQNTTLRASSLQLKKNSRYIYINHQNHGFVGLNNIVVISDVKSVDPNNYFFGNVPLTLINAEHKVMLIEHKVMLIETHNTIDYNNYLLDMGIYSNIDYIYTEDSFTISALTMNGINIKYINASYPITSEIQQGYQTIVESGQNYIKIKLNQTASKTSTVAEGNDNILIGIIDGMTSGFADPDYYEYYLKKSYNNVRKLKLVSTEFPNSELLVRDAPSSLKNNALYWQILDDGNYMYNINITPGNYDAITIKEELVNKILNVKREFSSYLNSSKYSENLIPEITINTSNNLFAISIMTIVVLSKSVSVSTETYNDDNIRLIITHPYHNLNINNVITLNGVIGLEDSTSTSEEKYYIPLDVINKAHKIESILGINNYVIRLNKYNPTSVPTSSKMTVLGGDAIYITYPLTIRFFFNYSDTLGNIFGFKNTGDELSHTIFDKIITNSTPYHSNSMLNSVGLQSYNTPILQFRTYPYIYMASEIFCPNINLKDSVGIFAKLLLPGAPGTFIYDQYVQINDEVPNTFAFLNKLEFKFLTPDGKQYNFNGQDHSYTLEIYEELYEEIYEEATDTKFVNIDNFNPTINSTINSSV